MKNLLCKFAGCKPTNVLKYELLHKYFYFSASTWRLLILLRRLTDGSLHLESASNASVLYEMEISNLICYSLLKETMKHNCTLVVLQSLQGCWILCLCKCNQKKLTIHFNQFTTTIYFFYHFFPFCIILTKFLSEIRYSFYLSVDDLDSNNLLFLHYKCTF